MNHQFVSFFRVCLIPLTELTAAIMQTSTAKTATVITTVTATTVVSMISASLRLPAPDFGSLYHDSFPQAMRKIGQNLFPAG